MRGRYIFRSQNKGETATKGSDLHFGAKILKWHDFSTRPKSHRPIPRWEVFRLSGRSSPSRGLLAKPCASHESLGEQSGLSEGFQVTPPDFARVSTR